MRSNSPFGKCSYCGKKILWVVTKAGKNMPVDLTLVGYCKPKEGEKAKERIVTQRGEVVAANKLNPIKPDGYGYIPHFATCKKRKRK